MPLDETERLNRLRELFVLDTPPEPAFDSLARLASEVCGTPIALLSLVDEHRQWFKANVGLTGVNETPRSLAFCAHAINGDALFEVPDATVDPRFATNPLVTGQPDIRFYAGVPLVLPGGARVGTLCVIDRQPRRLSEAQASTLRQLAAITAQTLEMRRALIEKSLATRSDYEAALAESEARFKSIVETQTELVSVSSPAGILVYANDSFARLSGRPAEEMVGRSLYDFVEPADRPAVRSHLERVIGQGGIWSNENRVVGADGVEQWVAWTNRLRHDRSGRPMLHSVGRIITEQRRAEQALRASETLLQSTGRISGVGGWQLDLPSDSLSWSAETRRLHEVPDDYRPTKAAALDFYPPAARETLIRAIEIAQTSGKPWDLELPLVTAAGREIRVRAVGEAERDGDRIVRLVGAIQDVTEQRLLEEQLLRQTETLSSIAEAIPALVVVVGADMRYRFANRAFEHWVGRPRESIIGRTVAEVMATAQFELRRPMIERALQGETLQFDQSFPGRRAYAHASISYIPLRLGGENGPVDGFVSVALDVTHHKREQVRLTQLAERDALTGLLNKSGFERLLAERLGPAERLAVLCIDLDHFKPVNDLYGHAMGDRLLQMFAARLSQLVRPGDAVARIGGDEFAVVLEGFREPQNVSSVAAKIVAAASAAFVADSVELRIGASVGTAIAGPSDSDWRQLVARADAMLYRAKRDGRGRHAADGDHG